MSGLTVKTMQFPAVCRAEYSVIVQLMDENEYRQTYSDVNELPCVFQKSILTRTCHCSRSHRFCLAEREGVACQSPAAQERCNDFLNQIRDNARFALGMASVSGKLPHGKEMKIQCGGLRGLQQDLLGDEADPDLVEDIYALLDQALKRDGEMKALPYPEIVQGIANFRMRKRSRRNQD